MRAARALLLNPLQLNWGVRPPHPQMTREKQFACISAAKARVLEWAAEGRVPLVHVDVVVPFVETDFDLDVWLFYDTTLNVTARERDGTTANAIAEYRRALSDAGYDPKWLTRVKFHVDSHENVLQNYEGSYFYFLR